MIGLRTDLAIKVPDLVEMFSKSDFDLGDQLNIEAYITQSGEGLSEVSLRLGY